MNLETKHKDDLINLGVKVELIDSKKKDGLTELKFSFKLENNYPPQAIAEILQKIEKPADYVFDVFFTDLGLGYLSTSNISENALQAFKRGLYDIRRLFVNARSQDEALRLEEAEDRSFDISENAAIQKRIDIEFQFELESVEIVCGPLSWNWPENENNL